MIESKTKKQKSESGVVDMKEAMLEKIERLRERKAKADSGADALDGFSTGFPSLDSRIWGLSGGNLVVIGSRPAMGKTSLALNIATNLAENGIKSLFFSLGMKKHKVLNRLLMTTSSNVELSKLKDSNLFILDNCPMTIEGIVSSATSIKEAWGIQAIFVDYLQLISRDQLTKSNRDDTDEISKSLKSLSMSLDVPVVCCAQLSRDVEKRSGHRPILRDLDESSPIDQDADVILGLLRKDYYDPYDRPGQAEIGILKNRNGPSGETIRFWFDKEKCLFTEEYQEPITEDRFEPV